MVLNSCLKAGLKAALKAGLKAGLKASPKDVSPPPALRSLKSPFPLFFSIFSFVSDSACIFCWETCFLTLLHASPLFVSDQLYVKCDGEVNRFPISFLFGLFPHPIGLAKRNLQNHFYGKHQNRTLLSCPMRVLRRHFMGADLRAPIYGRQFTVADLGAPIP